MVSLYGNLPGMQVSNSPQVTIPPSLLSTPNCPNIVIYNDRTNSVALLELTCPLNSLDHLESARDHKQGKQEYQQILSEFDRLGVPCFCDTIEIHM